MDVWQRGNEARRGCPDVLQDTLRCVYNCMRACLETDRFLQSEDVRADRIVPLCRSFATYLAPSTAPLPRPSPAASQILVHSVDRFTTTQHSSFSVQCTFSHTSVVSKVRADPANLISPLPPTWNFKIHALRVQQGDFARNDHHFWVRLNHLLAARYE